jgi:hypothetical protein
MKRIKNKKYLGVALILLVTLGGVDKLLAQSATSAPVIRPRVSVEFENEAVTLAKGFADAFRKIPPGGKYIKVSGSMGSEYLEGSVDSVEALDGVLYIRTEKGIIHIINARDIVTITNERPID